MPSEISLQEGSFELGRDASAQIVIPLPTVSSRHALLKIGEHHTKRCFLLEADNTISAAVLFWLEYKAILCLGCELYLVRRTCLWFLLYL